MVTDPKTGK
jgi:hypothetical protein